MMLKRRDWFYLLAAAAFLPVAVRMVQLAGDGGAALRRQAVTMAPVRGEIAAIRGRIYDADGGLLAYSVRSYDLIWHGSRGGATAELRRTLRGIFHDAVDLPPDSAAEGDRVLRFDLTMAEMARLEAVARRYPALEVVLRWERIYTGSGSAAREILGAVRLDNGTEHGVDGAELIYDDELRGVNGVFTVLSDRAGNWLDASFRMEKEPVPGRDVTLEAVTSALVKQAEDTEDAD